MTLKGGQKRPIRVLVSKLGLDGHDRGALVRQLIITKYTGGLCCICRDVPSKMILYDVGDMAQQAKKVERYCTECFKKESKKWVR